MWGDLSAVAAVIVALVSLYMAVKKAPHEAKQADGDAANNVVEAAVKLIEPYKARIMELENEVKALNTRIGIIQAEVDELRGVRDGAAQLFHQVKMLRGVPVYQPPEMDGDG